MRILSNFKNNLPWWRWGRSQRGPGCFLRVVRRTWCCSTSGLVKAEVEVEGWVQGHVNNQVTLRAFFCFRFVNIERFVNTTNQYGCMRCLPPSWYLEEHSSVAKHLFVLICNDTSLSPTNVCNHLTESMTRMYIQEKWNAAGFGVIYVGRPHYLLERYGWLLAHSHYL
jgi:hypothetical protein